MLFSVRLPYQSFWSYHPPPRRHQFRGSGAVAPLFRGVAKSCSLYFSRHHTLHSIPNLIVVVSKCRFQFRISLSSFGTYRVIAKYLPRIALAAAAPVLNTHSQLFIDCFEASCSNFVLPSLSYREPARLSRELPGFSRYVLGIICASESGVLFKRHSLHHSTVIRDH